MPKLSNIVIVIGASTGGTRALEYILTRLPITTPGIVIVQHISKALTKIFSARLNSICQLTIKVAVSNDPVKSGVVLIAPGEKHIFLKYADNQYKKSSCCGIFSFFLCSLS